MIVTAEINIIGLIFTILFFFSVNICFIIFLLLGLPLILKDLNRKK